MSNIYTYNLVERGLHIIYNKYLIEGGMLTLV